MDTKTSIFALFKQLQPAGHIRGIIFINRESVDHFRTFTVYIQDNS